MNVEPRPINDKARVFFEWLNEVVERWKRALPPERHEELDEDVNVLKRLVNSAEAAGYGARDLDQPMTV